MLTRFTSPPASLTDTMFGCFESSTMVSTAISRLFTDLFLDTNPIPVKAALAMMGRIEETYRLPLCEMAAGPRDKLKAALEELGLV